jgi:exonuclease III
MITTLLELKGFENKCLELTQYPVTDEVWCYDFDGVVHTKMANEESMKTKHRNPDHEWLSANFTNSNYLSLLPYLFSNTINHMKYGQSIGAKIVIVSANGWQYQSPILKILNYVGVNIKESDIHMQVYPKDIKLQELKCTLFMDDSCANITKIYNAYKTSVISTLQKLVFVVPEKEKEYDSKTHYEINLKDTLNICGKNDWHEDLLKNEGISLLDYPKHTFKLTSWNVYFRLMDSRLPYRLNNIKTYLKAPYRKPDILFTQESYFDLPMPDFNDYTHIYWSSRQSAISTHFNNSIFELNSNIVKLGFDDNTIVSEEIKQNDIFKDNSGESQRPILAIKLKHLLSDKNIIFINLWAPHYINVKGTGKMYNFLTELNKIIELLYTKSDRIIIAGDFNEFYEESKTGGISVDILNLDKVNLFLKQRNNTCCGSTNVGRSGGLFDGHTEKRPFDLLYDSDPVGSVVRVGTSKISDHLPISANISI